MVWVALDRELLNSELLAALGGVAGKFGGFGARTRSVVF